MTVSGSRQSFGAESLLSIHITAVVSDGQFKNRELRLNIARKSDFDYTEKYVGGLWQCKPEMLFDIHTDIERFGHLVTLIAAKAFKEVYLSFEAPCRGRAKVMSWHLSTTIED